MRNNIFRDKSSVLRIQFSVVFMILIMFCSGGIEVANAKTQDQRHVVLLGASVGKAWNLESLPQRLTQPNPINPKNSSNPSNRVNYRFEYIGLYRFDKGPALEELLKCKENRPDAIIIKECAAYFPSDITFEKAKNLMEQWIAQCQEKGIVPIPTTVAPVTSSRDERFKTHNPLKRIVKRILGIGMKTCMERIIEYNDWIKAYGAQHGLVVLDLEAPLRISEASRYLRDDLTKGDGLHLNSEAYKILDKTLLEALKNVKFPNDNTATGREKKFIKER